MVTQHLSDEDIQEYAMEHPLTGRIAEHAKACPACAARVADYRLLVDGMKEQEAPAFDFDLAALVLTKLPLPVPARTAWLDYLPALIVLFPVIGTGYIFRGYLITLFDAMVPLTVYLVLTTVVTVLIFLCVDMHKGYQKKMDLLDII